ncbi:MAG TPA: carbohydrate-binding family 9-like protein, partial [Pyrinomonadaceae bacterium]|nr:carbohydrate-binding family 9-like protein [Pyrinomonadaceae bacterium]
MMRTATIVLLGFMLSGVAFSQNKMDRILVSHIKKDIPVDAFADPAWKRAKGVFVETYWSGDKAPATRAFEARLLWSDDSLYVRFDAAQHEPLVVSDKPDRTKKSRGLWDRDVCEIFIAPNRSEPTKYFEFEVAPTGEWIDLGIEVTPEKRITDWDYASGMTAAAKI